MYNYIRDPLSYKNISIFSKEGKHLLKNMLSQVNQIGGAGFNHSKQTSRSKSAERSKSPPRKPMKLKKKYIPTEVKEWKDFIISRSAEDLPKDDQLWLKIYENAMDNFYDKEIEKYNTLGQPIDIGTIGIIQNKWNDDTLPLERRFILWYQHAKDFIPKPVQINWRKKVKDEIKTNRGLKSNDQLGITWADQAQPELSQRKKSQNQLINVQVRLGEPNLLAYIRK